MIAKDHGRVISAHPASWLGGLFFLGLLLISLWPSLFNHQPFFFDDTTTYLKGADAGMFKLTGVASDWTPVTKNVPSALTAVQNASAAADLHNTDFLENQTILAGRSIYYGLLLYIGNLLGGFWMTVVFQAALYLASIGLTLRHLDVFSWPRWTLVVLLLAVISPVAFYTSYLMPDLFAGLTILAAANLLIFGSRLSFAERSFWFFTLLLGVLFHSSHILLAAGMLVLGALVAGLPRLRLSGVGAGVIVAAIILGFLGEGLFNFAVTKLTGAAPIRPPFIMARLIADGPGYDYLKKNCPVADFKVCDYLDRLPTPNSDVFLWKHDKIEGVFTPEPIAVKRALSQEQYRFALAVVSSEPLSYLRSALKSLGLQLSLFGVPEFNYTGVQMSRYQKQFPQALKAGLQKTPAAQGTFPVESMGIVIYTTTILLFILYLYSLVTGRYAVLGNSTLALSLLIIGGIVANAVVCGLLSTPHDRYQARVIWLLPALVIMLELLLYTKKFPVAPSSAAEGSRR